MEKNQVNIDDLQKQMPNLLRNVMEGNEIIVTNSNEAIAIISPLKESNLNNLIQSHTASKITKEDILTDDSISEMWIG